MDEPSELIKHCRVCGDRALGFNFNGLSCESCKAFFRRNALRHAEYHCSRGGNCVIEIATRKLCQYCRLSKCFAIGMKKELIFVRDEKGSDKARKRRKFDESCDNSNASDCSSSYNNSENEQTQVKQLNSIEMRCLEDLEVACEALYREDLAEVIGAVDRLEDSVNLGQFYIRRIICFAKRLKEFQSLKTDDQLCIIKQSYLEIMICLTTFSYDVKQNEIFMIANEDGTKVFRVAIPLLDTNAGKRKYAASYRKVLKNFIKLVEQDLTIRNLCDSLLRFNFFKYCHLLKRYLDNKYKSAEESIRKYHSLTKLLDEIGMAAVITAEIYNAYLDSSLLSQVVAELYDLK